MKNKISRELTLVTCKGRIPGTTKPCGEVLFETDGRRFYFPGEKIEIEIEPPRVICQVCGYETRLRPQR